MTPSNDPSAASANPGSGSSGRSLPQWMRVLIGITAFVAALWVIEGVDALLDNRLDRFGIRPREVDGLDGVAFSPLLHGSFGHLMSNTIPALVLGFLVAVTGGLWRFFAATAIIWIGSGLGTWLIGGEHTLVVGFSGVIFGWITYLLLRGFFTRHPLQLVIALIVLLWYGTALFGVLPGRTGVSWQAHLCGAAAGVLAAFVLARNDRPGGKDATGSVAPA